MDNLLKDIRYAVKSMVRQPALTAVAVITVALGVGANTAIFSAVNAILLRPLPYQEPERIVQLWETNGQRGYSRATASLPNFVDWRDQNQSFEYIAAFLGRGFNLTGADRPERVQGAVVSSSFFSALGARPALGRGFLPEEEKPGNHRVAVLSHGLWQRAFGADPDIIGKTLTLSGNAFTIVGVLTQGFQFPDPSGRNPLSDPEANIEVLVPLAFDPQNLGDRGSHILNVLARLAPGVEIAQAQADMSTIASRLSEHYPDSNGGWGANVVPLHEQIIGRMKSLLYILLAAVGFILLIACTNVASLLLARAAARRKEIAIRLAIGATRWRLIRQLLTESVLLSLAGGAAGLLLAFWLIDAFVSLSPSDLPRTQEISVDARVLAFTVGLSILTGIIFGLAPALKSSRADLNEALKEAGRGSAVGDRNRIQSGLVVSEIALALVLLVGAGLMVRSFIRLVDVDTGFDTENLLTTEVALPFASYREPQKRIDFYEQVIAKIAALAGVEQAGAVSSLPLSGHNDHLTFIIEGAQPALLTEAPAANWRAISADYFQAMGMELLRGRYFTADDRKGSTEVVIINQVMAERFWPGQDPIGKRIIIYDLDEKPWREIVGIVENVRHFGMNREPAPEMYVPHWQRPQSSMTLVARTAHDPGGLAAAMRETVLSTDKNQPVYNVRTMKELVSKAVASPQAVTVLLGGFALVGAALAAIGIYGLVSYSVSRRTHEIGIRMALGAQSKNIMKMVVRQAMLLTAIGVSVGLVAAFALTRLMESLLYGVTATDPLTFIAVPLLLAGVALAACAVPARRAARVDPMVALRYE
jgi:putative ABC transport system permease protein